MLDEDTAVAETETAEDSTVSQEDVISSPQQDSETQETVQSDQAPRQSEIDHLKVLDSLKLDPSTKEALREGYLRQADYTRKTQDLAKLRGTIDEYQKVRPVIEFLDKNPDLFNEVYQKMQGNNQPAQPGQEEIPDDPKAYADWVKSNTIREMLQIQAQDQDFQKASKVDPRLDSDQEFGEMIARMVVNDPEFKAGQLTAESATAKAVKMFDTYMSKQISAAKNSLSEKAKARKSSSTTRGIPGSTQGKGKPMSIVEAAKAAEEELA